MEVTGSSPTIDDVEIGDDGIEPIVEILPLDDRYFSDT